MSEINNDSGQAATTYQNASRIFKSFLRWNVVVGQNKIVEQIVIAILCEGHALVESNQDLENAYDFHSLRQWTWNSAESSVPWPHAFYWEQMLLKKTTKIPVPLGPVFANVVLADEINRASPKTQSALLEAMQEKQVTVGAIPSCWTVPSSFLQLKPHKWKAHIPAWSQLDRFLLKSL